MNKSLGQRFKDSPMGFLFLLAVALWLGWKVLLVVYEVLSGVAVGFFTGLEASYGRLGGWVGYALLGLGLGAAAGAVAAQRRFRLSKRILAGAVALGLLLTGTGFLGGTATNVITAFERGPDPMVPADLPETSPDAALVAVTDPAAPDTTGEPASGLWLLTGPNRGLLPDWHYPTGATVGEIATYDTLRLVRQAQGWGRVVAWAAHGPPSAVAGWVRLTNLYQLAEPPRAEPTSTAEPFPDEAEATAAPDATRPEDATGGIGATTPPAASPEPEPAAPVWPTGHHEYTGHVGAFSAVYSLDWQSNGELSGSYYYDEKPGTIYRLTGATTANGELRLLEFTRGRQSARCVLHRQGEGYAGTMFNTDGREFSISLD